MRSQTARLDDWMADIMEQIDREEDASSETSGHRPAHLQTVPVYEMKFPEMFVY